MKAIFIIHFFILVLTSNAASQITIEVSNPEPRVGESVTIFFPAEIFDNYLSSKLPVGLNSDGRNSGQIEKKVVPTREGKLVLGPFKIRVNGKRYKTNAITINVQPALTPKAGIWVRVMQRDGEEIILLEQIIRREAVHTFSSNGTGVSWQSEDSDFIELSQNVVFDGVTFQAMNSGWGHSPNTLIDWPYEFAYSYKFYRIKKSADFQGPLKLSREHFLNLKSDVSIPDISIR